MDLNSKAQDTGTMRHLKVFSYNIHKGFSSGIKKFTLLKMREQIRALDPDIIFLQEVHGSHSKHQKKILNWPDISQFEYLAHEIWPHYHYGKNAIYPKGDHGNAILSKHPIHSADNTNISINRFEKRGLLHVTFSLPRSTQKIHGFCTHLNLLESGRQKQLSLLQQHIQKKVSPGEPVILAGDFNDWRQRAHHFFEKTFGLQEVFISFTGNSPKTYPSFFPLFSLDRIYTKGFKVKEAKRLLEEPWRSLSDHIPLTVDLLI